MPDWKRAIRENLSGLNLAPTREAAIVEELSEHLDQQYHELLSGGADDKEASETILSSLNQNQLLTHSLNRLEERRILEPIVPEVRRGTFMESVWQDFRYAIRTLLKNPGFAAIAVITLAMGIGANTVIFSAVNSLLIRPLPLPDMNRLAFAFALREGYDPSLSGLVDYEAYQQRSHSFESLGIANDNSFNLIGRGEPERVLGANIDGGYLKTLGVSPSIGRSFTVQEDQAGGRAVALIGYGLWQRRYGGDSNLHDKSLDLDGQSYDIVGVMPQGFDLPDHAEIWVPAQLNIDSLPINQRMTHNYEIVGRLRQGISVQQADSELKSISKQLGEEYPKTRKGWDARVIGLRQELVGDFNGRIQRSLYALLGAVAFLLLICCVNVASLLLARGVAREREIAIRRALGAGWLQIARQLLTESMLIALIGGIVGLGLAYLSLPFLKSLSPIESTALSGYVSRIPLDSRVAVFTLLVTLLTGFLFGLIPALKMSRSNELMPLIKQGDQRSVGSAPAKRLLSVLVAAEMAVAIALLTGGWLMVQSFKLLQHIDPGFRTDKLLTMNLELSRSKYPQRTQKAAYVKQVLDHVRTLPGVVSDGASSETPLGFQGGDTTFSVEGNPPINPENVPITSHRLVTPDYLKTLGVTLISGRLLDEHDTADSTPVVVISEELARQSWPEGVDPIGKRVKRGRPDDATYPWMVVVGVVKNIKEDRFNFRVNRPVWYLPYEQAGNNSSISLLVETAGDPTTLTSAVQNAIHAVDPDQPVANVTTMQSVVSNVFVTERFSAVLMASLAGLGLVLAAVGLYGMVAYTVNQRKGEMGLRIALGATDRDVIRLVIGQGMKPVLTGAAIGVICSAGIFGILQFSLTGGSDLLFGISMFDPATYISVCGFLVAVALMAILIPAARAAKTDPLIALRSE